VRVGPDARGVAGGGVLRGVELRERRGCHLLAGIRVSGFGFRVSLF